MVAEDYVFYDYQQLFIEAGPQLIIEVDSNGKLVAKTGESSLSTCLWSGNNAHYKGYWPNPNVSWDQIYQSEVFLDFPIEISEDMKTMTISPIENYYLNLRGADSWFEIAPVVKSDIVLKKK